MRLNHPIKLKILLILSITGIAIIFCLPVIHQDKAYHLFADVRNCYSISNFWNVITNIPFLLIGFLGTLFLLYQFKAKENKPLYFNKLVLFASVLLIGVGSMVYHLNPKNSTLLFDRIPMTIAFMAFFSIIIGECICVKSGEKTLIPFLIIGVCSVIFWKMTEERGNDDLRFYAAIQFLPLLLIPFILVMYKSPNNGLFWYVLLCYLIAKLFEHNDFKVNHITHGVSGHALKHVISSIGIALLLLNEVKNYYIYKDDRNDSKTRS